MCTVNDSKIYNWVITVRAHTGNSVQMIKLLNYLLNIGDLQIQRKVRVTYFIHDCMYAYINCGRG